MTPRLLPCLYSLLACCIGLSNLRAESCQWSGPASGNWNDASNWTPSQVPGSGDTASISGNVAVVIDSTISISGLSVNSGSSLEVASGGTLNILDGMTLSGPLTNAGVVNWMGGDIGVKYRPDWNYMGGIANVAGGLFDIRCDQQVFSTDSYYYTPTISNAGVLRKSAGTGAADIRAYFHNTGSVDTLTGTLRFWSACTGQMTISASLAGITSGVDYGKIEFSQPPAFGGSFTLTLRDGFLPAPGESFDITSFPSATGDFTNFVGLDLGNGLRLDPRFEGGGITLVAVFQPLGAVPTLTVTRTVSGVFLRWPVEFTTWDLHRSLDLKTWQPAVLTGVNSAVVPAAFPAEFFRLQESE